MKLLWNCFFLTLHFTLFGQYADIQDHNAIILDIQTRLQQGEKLALRDLANIWLKEPNNSQFKQLLQQHLLLTEEEWDWSADNLPKQLLTLYYQKAATLRFSEFLGIFFLTPIENRTVKVDIKEWHPVGAELYIDNQIKDVILSNLDAKNYQKLEASIQQLQGIDNSISDVILTELLQSKKLFKIAPLSTRQSVVSTVFQQLSKDKSIALLLKLGQKKKIPLVEIQYILTRLTNHDFSQIPLDSLQWKWNYLLQENNNDWTAIRTKGYEIANKARKIFFEAPVDYFAWILGTTNKDTFPWIYENAFQDLIASEHPRVLFYLAGLQFKAWKRGEAATYLEQLEKRIDVQIALENQSGQFTTKYEDAAAQLHFLIYWSKHYSDYEWSATPDGLFINLLQKSEIIDSYERYFRRLNSPNDSAAVEAFFILTEGIPVEINRLVKKYRSLLRTYNEQLPPFKFNVLENICHLTDYARRHHFDYLPTSHLRQVLEKLDTELLPEERYKLENQLIDSLQLKDLTILEYWATTKAHHTDLNYSIGRILDYLYAKYWSTIIQDKRALRFYLLKSKIYENIGSFGIARLFSNKLEMAEEQVQPLLKKMIQFEQNEFIQKAILDILPNKTSELAQTNRVQDLIDDPAYFDKAAIAHLPPFTEEELKECLARIKKESNKKAIKNIETYLADHASIDMVPAIFEYPSESWSANSSSAKVAVKLLESLYGFSLSRSTATSLKAWYELWNTQGKAYTDWKKILFDQQLKRLSDSPEVSIKNINSITQSAYYQPSHRPICLRALRKVKKVRTIRQLHIKPLISVKNELSFLASLPFSHRDLDNLNKVLDIDDASKFLDFVLEKSATFPIDQKGFLLNNLFRQDWLFQKVHIDYFSEIQRTTFAQILKDYLRQSKYLTEFEEQATQLNLLLLTHARQSLPEKVSILTKSDLEEAVKLKWLELVFARLEFEDIPQVLATRSELTDFDETILLQFISQEFGLPIYDWSSPNTIKVFEERLKTLSKLEFYKQYVADFGVDFQTKKEALDFDKIYRLLQFDLVIPFAGEGGQYRDKYIYGLIKILELYFETTLGFSPKLNEYQTFFRFNSSARADAWRAYLLEQQLVEVDRQEATSFKERKDVLNAEE